MKAIFGGRNSRRLWAEIRKVKDDAAHDALYSLGCKCQELEAVVRALVKKGSKERGKQ